MVFSCGNEIQVVNSVGDKNVTLRVLMLLKPSQKADTH